MGAEASGLGELILAKQHSITSGGWRRGAFMENENLIIAMPCVLLTKAT